jgi:small-conductance mechanosensitive channel/uncharacterized protein YunC (DUF1805 family)
VVVVGVVAALDRFSGVQLNFDRGVVRLTGTVPTVEARRQVEQLAAEIDGVRFVDNLLDVEVEPPPPESAQEEDDAIRERLLGVFRQIGALSDVQVTVRSGVVSLQGSVADDETRQRAVALAESQEGVLFVDDQLEEVTDVAARLGPALETAWDHVRSVVAMGPLLLVAGVVVALFALLASALRRWELVYRGVADRPLLRATIGRVVWGVTMAVGLLIALEILDATALVGAVVGTAGVFGLALGFAFQDIVENYLAGLMLSLQQPFGKDDLVEIEGARGLVMRLTPRNTLIMTVEGNHLYVPNATVFKGRVTNFSRNPYRRFDFAVGVGVDEDLSEVIATGMATLGDMPGVTDEPEPFLRIDQLGDSSVVVRVHGWVDQRSHDYGAVRTEAIRRIKEAFDEAGYDMPEPIYRVSMTQAAPAAKRPAPRADHRPAVQLSRVDTVERQARQLDREEGGEDLLSA